MFDLRRSPEVQGWFSALRDQQAYDRIVLRLARMRAGHFGDVKFFDGLGELRIDTGPGYRVCFVQRGQTIIFLLCGGDKSTQNRDITRAKSLAQEV